MRKEERKNRFSLTLLFGIFIFCILFISLVLAVGIIYVLTVLGWMPAYDSTAPDALQLLLFMALISLLIGAGTAILTGKFPMQPVNKVINTMNRLASGDFKARLSFKSTLQAHPAVKEMTDSFNTMASELERTEMFRSDFINNFSHEFKTPIVSIAGFAKLLRRGDLTEAQKQEYLAIIEEESLRLADMATNVMNLTKVENQSILAELTTFNLSEQLRACVLLLEEKWSSKEMELDLQFQEHTIRADEELLKQIWINLLDNAIKFSPSHGEIKVRIAEKPGVLAVSITNYGTDIPADKTDMIFRKFYQADESHAAMGNGIGLAVVKRAVQLHEGTVTVQSENGITTFTVELPVT